MPMNRSGINSIPACGSILKGRRALDPKKWCKKEKGWLRIVGYRGRKKGNTSEHFGGGERGGGFQESQANHQRGYKWGLPVKKFWPPST